MSEEAKASAYAETRLARAAAERGDYARALEHFQQAQALRPSPRLHYNIAVCHQHIMLGHDEDTPQRERARSAAVDAYNRYLYESPDAPDRADVAARIASLGGRPATLDDWSIEAQASPPFGQPPTLLEPERSEQDVSTPAPTPGPDVAGPAAPGPVNDDPSPAATGHLDANPAVLPRARVGLAATFGITNLRQLTRTSEVATLPYLGFSARAGAFVGDHRRANLGAQLNVWWQPTATEKRHRLTGGHLGFVTEYGRAQSRHPNVQWVVGGLVGVSLQALLHNGDSAVQCPQTDGRRVSVRAGLLVGARLGTNLLVGARRNHEVSFRFNPALALYGSGATGDAESSDDNAPDCDSVQTPFRQVGLGSGPALVMTFDVGYAPRF